MTGIGCIQGGRKVFTAGVSDIEEAPVHPGLGLGAAARQSTRVWISIIIFNMVMIAKILILRTFLIIVFLSKNVIYPACLD